MRLLDSAKLLLIESLENINKNNKLVFAILHAVTSLELILKERLFRIHPILIYQDIDNPFKTVTLRNITKRLCNFGISLNQEDLKVISTVAEWRNQIVHHMLKVSEEQATRKLGLLYDIISHFLEKELNVQLKDFLPKSLFKIADKFLSSWKRFKKDAVEKAIKEGNVFKSQECPICGGIDTVSIRDNEGFCHLCESKLKIGKCPLCHKQAIGGEEDNEGNIYHWKCLNDYGLAYLEMMRETYFYNKKIFRL